jgi:hypothetical protein
VVEASHVGTGGVMWLLMLRERPPKSSDTTARESTDMAR